MYWKNWLLILFVYELSFIDFFLNVCNLNGQPYRTGQFEDLKIVNFYVSLLNTLP